MKFLRMVGVNCKRYFKDIKVIVLMFILPIVCVLMVSFLVDSGKKGTNVKVAVINEDNGALGSELTSKLGVNSVYSNKEKSLEDLKNYNYIAVYEIPESFSADISNGVKPLINAYKLEEGNSTQVFEANLEVKLNEMVKVNILQSNKLISGEEEINKNFVKLEYNMKPGLLSQGSFTSIMLIMFYLVTFSTTYSSDLLGLRKSRILERFLSTNNRGYEIMGSIYLSMLIVQAVLFTASFLVMNLVFRFNFENFGMLILNIILMSMVCISLVVMITRIFKDSNIASLVLTLTSLVMFFLYIIGIIGETSSKVPQVIMTLGKFTPFYWALGSIEKSVIFPNAIILVLMALVLFSAGSIRYSSFAKES